VSVCQDGLVWLLEKGRFIATGTAGEYKSGEVVDGGEEEVAEPLVGCEGSGVESHVARVDLFVFFGGVCGLIEGRCSHPPFGLLSFLLLPCIKIWHACPRKKVAFYTSYLRGMTTKLPDLPCPSLEGTENLNPDQLLYRNVTPAPTAKVGCMLLDHGPHGFGQTVNTRDTKGTDWHADGI
jgi:hypothetical protein